MNIVALIHALAVARLVYGSCLDHFNTSLPLLPQLFELKYSGKGINEVGDYEACTRKGWQYMVLETKGAREIKAFLGVCLPIKCEAEEVELFTSQYKIHLKDPGEYPLTPAGVIFITLTLTYFLTILISTYLHYISDKYLNYTIIKAFTLIESFQNLSKIRQNNKLGVINGLKIISYAWVVYSHCLLFKTEAAVINVEEVQNILLTWWSTLVVGGEFAVDIFFYLGGFLLSYFLLIELEKSKGKIQWALIYLHRYLRIVPCLGFVIGFNYFIIRTLGSGPLWGNATRSMEVCGKYWWTNLLFINNFVPDGDGNKCFDIGWYLANDMQLFVVGPVIVFFYFKCKNKILPWAFFGTIFVINLGLLYFIAYYYDYRLLLIDKNNATFFFNFYIKPYTKFPVYLQGIFSGIVMSSFDKISENKINDDKVSDFIIKKLTYNKIVSRIWIVIGLFFMIFLVLIQRPVYSDINKDVWSRNANALSLTFLKPGFILGLQVFILPVLMGQSNVINLTLGNSILEPFSKISYCGYLVHFQILLIYFTGEGNTLIGGIYIFKEFTVIFLLSSVAGMLLHVTVEAPFQNLEKALLK